MKIAEIHPAYVDREWRDGASQLAEA